MTPDQLAKHLRTPIDKRTVMQRAVYIVQRAAMHEAPVKRGTLRRSHYARVEGDGSRGVVGTTLKYGRAVHEGTRPRVIRPVRARALFWPGARHPVKSARHPGTRPNRWLERAANKSRGPVEQALAAWGNGVLGART